jgi:hypothetical protein
MDVIHLDFEFLSKNSYIFLIGILPSVEMIADERFDRFLTRSIPMILENIFLRSRFWVMLSNTC